MSSNRASPVPPDQSLQARFPQIAAQLHPNLNNGVTADEIHANSKKKYWWIRYREFAPHFVWKASVVSRTRKDARMSPEFFRPLQLGGAGRRR